MTRMSFGNNGDEDLNEIEIENDADRMSDGEFEKDIPAPSMEPRLEFDVDNETARHSKISMSMPERANADRAFANSQAELKKVGLDAKANGDAFTHRDCAIRYQYANVMEYAAAAQNNINRYNGNDKFLAQNAREDLASYKGRIEELRTAHGELVQNAAKSPTTRAFASIDQPRREDPAKKQAWDQRVQLRAVGEAAEARGDMLTRYDCAFRYHLNEAQASGDMEKLAKVKAQHELFRERAAEKGRSFNHIDQPRGEDPAGKQAWEQRQAWTQRQELPRAIEAAQAKGDTWEATDCRLRMGHADAKLTGDRNKEHQFATVHAAFVEQAKAKTGREFNGIDKLRGEDQGRKAAWEQHQAQQPKAPASDPSQFRDAARESDGLRGPAKVRKAKAAPTAPEKPQAASSQPEQAPAAPMSKLDAVKAKAREHTAQATPEQPSQGPAKAPATEPGKKPTPDQQAPATASAEAADAAKPEPTKKDGPVTRSGQARWLKRQGATEPGFIRYATKTPQNFKAAQGLYEQRGKGFDKLKAESRNLTIEQQHPTLTEQQHPVSPQEERRRPHAR